MKEYIKNIGLLLVLTGVVMLFVSFIAGWTNSNALQITSLVLIIGGIITHVIQQKHSSRY